MTDKKDDRTERTFKQGLVGGVLGAFVGAPGLGMALGAANANKDKIKEFGEKVDKSVTHKKMVCKTCGYNPCKCKQLRAIDNPTDWF